MKNGNIFDVPTMKCADIIAKGVWIESVEFGAFIPSDGSGYWGTEKHYSYDFNCFNPAPENATHVHWFNR